MTTLSGHKGADPYNRGLALEKMLQDVMLKRRKDELELYKLFASDPAFKSAWSQNIEQVLNKNLDNWPSELSRVL